jgi:hypothetical protein
MPIKAYHQVGSEEWSPDELSEVLEDVIDAGRIEPASQRLDRHEMEAECFTAPERGATLKQRFEDASPQVMAALEAIAREKIRELPESGVTQSLFNCLDLIGGDLERVFLMPGGWYSVPNGFVFDAEELLMRGGKFRKDDLLGGYAAVIEGASEERLRSVAAAKRYIERELKDIHTYFEYTGHEGVEEMRQTLRHPSPGARPEIVWSGSLPLKMAKEAWRNGRNVTQLLRKKRR